MWNRELLMVVCVQWLLADLWAKGIFSHIYTTQVECTSWTLSKVFYMRTELLSLCTLVLYKVFPVCSAVVIQNNYDKSWNSLNQWMVRSWYQDSYSISLDREGKVKKPTTMWLVSTVLKLIPGIWPKLHSLLLWNLEMNLR